jgi:hypothetical protein
MFELFLASDTARRLIGNSLEFNNSPARKTKNCVRWGGLRSVSAAALRGLAERLEPLPSAPATEMQQERHPEQDPSTA